MTGITSFKNCIVLFVTLDKRSKEDSHKYNDVFVDNGKKFHWESQNKNTTETSHIKEYLLVRPLFYLFEYMKKLKVEVNPLFMLVDYLI
nr:DUF3427 domain-containing protein [Proteus mirabilis]